MPLISYLDIDINLCPSLFFEVECYTFATRSRIWNYTSIFLHGFCSLTLFLFVFRFIFQLLLLGKYSSTFHSPLFFALWRQFIFCPSQVLKWNITFCYTRPILELYSLIFLHEFCSLRSCPQADSQGLKFQFLWL